MFQNSFFHYLIMNFQMIYLILLITFTFINCLIIFSLIRVEKQKIINHKYIKKIK